MNIDIDNATGRQTSSWVITRLDGSPVTHSGLLALETFDRKLADVLSREWEPKAHRVEPAGDYLQRINRAIREGGK
jgi:hypothetical protein